jgi:hypothetical protein
MKLISLFLFFVIQNLSAETFSKKRIWYGMFGKKEIGLSQFLFHEVQLRYDLDTPTMQQTLFRFGLLRKIGDNHEIGLLGGHIQTGNSKEYRPTFQYSYLYNSLFSLRNRLEARFLEDQSESSLRYRLLFRLQKSLTHSFEFISWNEPFINFTREDWSGKRFFERNRFFLGSKLIFDKMSIESGYLNQYVPRSNQKIMEHSLVIYLFY